LLRPGDWFADVGANIGSYTLLASAQTGAYTIAFEPVPQTYNILLRNVELNHIGHKVKALNMGAGSQKGVLNFTKSFDTGNHVSLQATNSIAVAVDTLDTILADELPCLLKIDVEGFETEVINGAVHLLKSDTLKAVIIELNGSGSRYGFSDDDIHEKLLENGFLPYLYHPFERQLTETKRGTEHNILYIRDVTWVMERLASANRITIKGVTF
jgi:FkbM family methyltransferase